MTHLRIGHRRGKHAHVEARREEMPHEPVQRPRDAVCYMIIRTRKKRDAPTASRGAHLDRCHFADHMRRRAVKIYPLIPLSAHAAYLAALATSPPSRRGRKKSNIPRQQKRSTISALGARNRHF